MLPRLQDWSTTTDIFLQGDPNQFWPEMVSANSPGVVECPTNRNEVTDWCLTAGHYGLLVDLTPPIDWGEIHFGGPAEYPLSTLTFNRNLTGSIRDNANPKLQTWTLAPHLATCYLQSALFCQWAAIYFYKRRSIHAIELPSAPNTVTGKFPVVRTICVPPKLTNASTHSTLFPVLSEFTAYDWSDGELQSLQ
jgi:hypothetical protein